MQTKLINKRNEKAQKFTTERAEIDMHLSFPQNAFSLIE